MIDTRRASALALEEYALRGPGRTSRLFIATTLVMAVAACVWAARCPIDIRARGQGSVVTASQNQVVQNLEGGIVTDIRVKNGDSVKRGQLLVKLSPTALEAELKDRQANAAGLKAAIARLSAEARLAEPNYPTELRVSASDTVSNEQSLHRQRISMLDSQLDVLQSQLSQRRSELADLQARKPRLSETVKLIEEQLVQMRALVEGNSASRAELVQLEKEAAGAKVQLSLVEQQIPGAQAAIRGGDERMREKRETFRAEAMQELTEKQIKLKAIDGSVRARVDQVQRTQIFSPVDGVIKTLHVASKGEVVAPGRTIAEITPTGDALRVEAHIMPADIGFVMPGQSVNVRLTAFDYAIFGNLVGEVESISPDTVKDEADPRVIYYRVRVRTKATQLKGPAGPLELKPGMVADVDILTGRRTVLEYLLKPLTRSRIEAFRER
ncbi:MAG: toxin-related secretion protein [Cyanobacteria bacterium RYN_339]|nr:toxin-related secretion protein [Cyanobacteria bacterium RYN_339]